MEKTTFTSEDHKEFERALLEEMKAVTFTHTEADSFLRGWLAGKGYDNVVKNHLGFIRVIVKQGNRIKGQR